MSGSMSGRPLDFSNISFDERMHVMLRFADKFRGVHGECWVWTGSLIPSGYGSIGIRRGHGSRAWSIHMAHRVSFALFNGPIPPKRVIMHICDNRRCVNPDHLLLADQQANIRDAERKGRMYHGKRKRQALPLPLPARG